MRRIKSCLLILLTLWLPIQAAAAVTMPFCRHAPQQGLVMAAMHCHEQTELTSAALSDPAAKLDVFDCDNCQICHLATAGFLLAGAGTLFLPTASILVANPERISASHIPEPLQQPPRR